MPLPSGSKLGPYEIQSALGAGGMGEVYRARDTRLERTVAIKILPPHLSSNAELNARFEREARAVSSLNHPHICHLYDVGSQDGTAFLVMEYLDGETLADRLHKGPLPLKQALEFGMQIAQALATAHRAGILHRDLKPQNVMLTAGGAKLLDFGLAKESPTLGGGSAVSGMTPSTPTMTIAQLSSPAKPLTQRGTLVGTFQYMAPEVLQGAEADARSDIFSLGCVLYEMVTGRRAFEGKSQLSVLTGILEHDPGPVSQVIPTSPAALDHLVKTCLEKNPEERFQTVQDVGLHLKWIAAGVGKAQAAPVEATNPLGSRLGWIVAGIAFLIALGLVAAYLATTSRVPAVVRSSILPPAGAEFVTMAPASGPAVVSPDGSKLAFVARDDKGKTQLYVRALTAVTPTVLLGTQDAMYPFWSPDSREIGFFAMGKMKRISAAGGPAQIICDATDGRGGTWNKDGVVVFAPSVTGPLFKVAANGGDTTAASKINTALTEDSHRWPQFLPDGRHFIFWSRNSMGVGKQGVYVGTVGSLETKLVLQSPAAALYADGYILFMREQTLLAQPFDVGKLEISGEPKPVGEHVAINGATNVPEFSASETGILTYHSGDAAGAWDLLWFTREGKPAGAIAEHERYYYPAISPDGDRVAVSLFDGTQGIANIWIMDMKRGTKSRLTFANGFQLGSMWSRDGKTLYYAADAKGSRHIYERAADGSGSEQTVLESPAMREFPYSLSADGNTLVYTRREMDDPHKRSEIWALPLKGDRKPFPIVQTAFDCLIPTVSPSGKLMAYHSNESGRQEVYVTGFPGGGAKWQVSTNGGVDARWRGDGKELYFLDPSDNLMAVDVDTSGTAPRLGVPHALFQAIGVQRQVGTYVVTPDGKKFLVNTGSTKQGSEPLTLVTNWTAELKK